MFKMVLVVIGCFACLQFSQAQILQKATIDAQGTMAAGGYGSFIFNGSQFMMSGHFDYAFNRRMMAEGRVAVGSNYAYFGGYMKYHLLRKKFGDLAIWGGAAKWNEFMAVSVAPILSRPFKLFTAYIAPAIHYPLKSGVDMSMGMSIGAIYPITHEWIAAAELIMGLSNYYNGIAGGVRYVF